MPTASPITPAAEAANPHKLDPPFGQAPNRMHDSPTAARLIGLAPGTLEVDRTRRRLGLGWFKVGRRVAYKESDLLAFLDRCAVEA
jgi:hypothetical protein